MMSRNNLMAVVAVTALIVPVVAHAYIVPAEALLSRAAKGRTRLDLTGLVLSGIHEKDGERTPVWEAVTPEARRRELRRPDGVDVTLDIGRQRYTFKPGSGPVRPVRGPANPFTRLALPVDAAADAAQVMATLRTLGIDPSVTSLGRQDRRVVYVIGAGPREPNRPQLWLDKKLLVPVRLVTFDGNKVRRETRWIGFDAPLTAPYFPRRIETWVNGEMTEAVTYSDIKINPKLDKTLLAPPQ